MSTVCFAFREREWERKIKHIRIYSSFLKLVIKSGLVNFKTWSDTYQLYESFTYAACNLSISAMTDFCIPWAPQQSPRGEVGGICWIAVLESLIHIWKPDHWLTFLVYGRRYFHFKVVLQAGGVSGCGAVGSNSSHPEMVRLQRPGLLHFLKQVHHLEQRLKLSPPFVLQHWIKSYLWSFGWSRKKNLIAFPGKGGPQWANAL